MRGPKPNPITIRGETFPSISEAAKNLGVGKSAIFLAKREGRLDGVGMSIRGKPKPFQIGPYKFRSEVAASVAMGMGETYIGWATKGGDKDRLDDLSSRMNAYLRGIKGSKPAGAKRGPKAKPVTIRGVEYASVAAAEKAIGVPRMTIYAARLAGTLDLVGIPKQKSGRGFSIGPHHFPSRCAASRALGKSKDYISDAMNSGSESRMRNLARLMSEYARARA